jgi:hypothetical protein
MIAIQGVPVDTIEIESSSCSDCTDLEPSAVLSATATTAAGGAAASSAGEADTEQRSAAIVDMSTVQLLVSRMRANGARVHVLIDPASVNRKWIRRGRAFWLQQRCRSSSVNAGTADDATCCHQDQEHVSQSDVDHQGVDLPILGGVLSYDMAHPVQLRFGFRRACYILRCDASWQGVDSQCASTLRTPCSGQAEPCDCTSDQTGEEAGGPEKGKVGGGERKAAIESDQLVALAETWLSGTTSE